MDGAAEPGLGEEIGKGIGDARGEHVFAVDHPDRFLGGEGEEGPLGVDDLVADFHLGILRDESLGNVGIVAVFIRGAAEVAGEVGDDLVLHGGGQVLAAGHHGRCGANGADRSHEDAAGGEGDQGAGGTGIGIDVGDGGNGRAE